MTPAEDYTAGETNDPELITHRGRWVEGEDGHREQFHVWCYLGPSWGTGPPRFSDEAARDHTRRIVENGGAMMWDVAFEADGKISGDFFRQLKAIGKSFV